MPSSLQLKCNVYRYIKIDDYFTSYIAAWRIQKVLCDRAGQYRKKGKILYMKYKIISEYEFVHQRYVAYRLSSG